MRGAASRKIVHNQKAAARGARYLAIENVGDRKSGVNATVAHHRVGGALRVVDIFNEFHGFLEIRLQTANNRRDFQQRASLFARQIERTIQTNKPRS